MNNYISRIKQAGNTASRFSNFEGDASVMPSSSKLGQLSRTFTVLITNASSVDSTYVVFGYNANGEAASAGSGAGVTVSISQSSHAQVKRTLNASPVILSGAKYKTNDADNFDFDITYSRTPMTGGSTTEVASPLNYQEPENQNTLLVRIPDFDGMTLDGDTALSGSIKANSTITLLLTIGGKIDLVKATSNESVIVATGKQNPTGTRPLQMVVEAAR